jgi:hypothetical protein
MRIAKIRKSLELHEHHTEQGKLKRSKTVNKQYDDDEEEEKKADLKALRQ